MTALPDIPAGQKKGREKYPGDKVVTAHLFKSIKDGDLPHLALVLHSYPEAREYLSEAGHSPLQMAIVQGKDDSLRWLLANGGININQVTQVFGTALHCAIYRRKPGMVSQLLDYDADMHAADCHGKTPLQAAEEMAQPEISRLLREETQKRLAAAFNAGTQARMKLKKPLAVRRTRPPAANQTTFQT